jgi:hypothetical protein
VEKGAASIEVIDGSRGAVNSLGVGDRLGCNECKELLESEQWLALQNSKYKSRGCEDYILS